MSRSPRPPAGLRKKEHTMSEANKPFVVTDRRKFTLDGAPRPDAERSEREPEALSISPPVAQPAAPAPPATAEPETSAAVQETQLEGDLPALTPEQLEQSKRAYEATADRLETAIRSSNPGMDHPPAMNFEQLVQSVYLTAIMQLGGGTPEGEQPRVDLLGARSSIDMMGVLAEKTSGNLSEPEQLYLDSALFELRMAFLEMTQVLARSAQARAGQQPGAPGGFGGGTGGSGGFGGGTGGFGGGTPTLVR